MQYTHEQRAQALGLLAEVGKAEAARRTGIPEGTIASWGARTGTKAPPPETMREATEAKNATLADRKVELAGQLRALAVKATAKLAERIDADEISAKDLVQALTAAIDRMQLLTGAATERVETVGIERTPEVAAELAKVLPLVRSA